jgi:hypothetical protein
LKEKEDRGGYLGGELHGELKEELTTDSRVKEREMLHREER